MRFLLAIIAVYSVSCSAAVINRGSPLVADNVCDWKFVPYADATAGVIAGVAETQMTEEYKKRMAMMAATDFVVSAIMGKGEILELECLNIPYLRNTSGGISKY